MKIKIIATQVFACQGLALEEHTRAVNSFIKDKEIIEIKRLKEPNWLDRFNPVATFVYITEIRYKG